MTEAPMTQTTTRWWPDGTYCPNGREHLSLVTITTTAPLTDLHGIGAERGPGSVVWCDCGCGAYAAA